MHLEKDWGCIDAARPYGSICIQTIEPHEKNYPTHDLELAAVIFTLKDMETLFIGRPSTADHKNLKYIFTQKELNMRQNDGLS